MNWKRAIRATVMSGINEGSSLSRVIKITWVTLNRWTKEMRRVVMNVNASSLESKTRANLVRVESIGNGKTSRWD